MIRKYGILSDIIYTIIISGVLAYLINPIVNYFEKYNINRGLGVFIIYAIILGIIFIFSFLVIPKTGKEMKRLISVLPMHLQRVSQYIDRLYMKYYVNVDNMPPLFKGIEEVIINSIDNVQNVIITSISKFIGELYLLFQRLSV